MEVPDVLKNLNADDEPKLAFIATLLHEEPCGIIVKSIAFFDKTLVPCVLLAFLRKHGTSVAGYTEAQVGKMSFFEKINALAGLRLGSTATEIRDLVVATLTPMRKIRNVSAHDATLTSAQAEELWAEADCRALLTNFPCNFKEESNAVQRALQELLDNSDFNGK